MRTNNLKKFQKLNAILQKEDMVFISSNSGTGKTTYFKWLSIRKAVKGILKLDIFFRFENEIEQKFNNESFLKPPQNASKRLLKLADKVAIIKDKENYFLIKKENGEKIGQALAINIQKKYKSTENSIYSDFAIYDEVMPDDNQYCQNELYKFSRLIDTRARNRKYKVLCLYNNTQPYFPYKESFEKAGAKFIDFVGVKFNQPVNKGIQSILSKSDYGEVYNFNNYQYYKEFYKEYDCKHKETIFYLNIQNHLFHFKDCGEFYILKPTRKIKNNREVVSLCMQENDFPLIDYSSRVIKFLQIVLQKRLLFANTKKNTIFIKELADFLNLSYNN